MPEIDANTYDEASSGVGLPLDAIRMAAEYRWMHPSATWEAVAAHVGRTTRTVERWRQTTAWKVAFREAGDEYMERLAPAAVSALLKAWAKGNSAGALDVLRSFGLLRPNQLEVEHRLDPDQARARLVEMLNKPQVRLLEPPETA